MKDHGLLEREEKIAEEGRQKELQDKQRREKEYSELSNEWNKIADEKNSLINASNRVIVTSMKKKEELSKRIAELETKRDALGFMKNKEKKDISAQIDELWKEMPSQFQIEEEKKVYIEKKYQPRIDELNVKLTEISKKMEALR